MATEDRVPDPNAQYYYDLNQMWIEGQFEALLAPKGMVVHSVRQRAAGGFSFRIGTDPTIYRCQYGWAFVLNTSRNTAKFNRLNKIRAQIKELERVRNELHAELITLEAPKKLGPTEG